MRKLLALLAVCSVTLACDTRRGSSLTAPFSAELGTYALRTVSGSTLPITLQSVAPNTVRRLLADTITFTSGGNVRDVYYVSTTTTGSTGAPVVGSVQLSGKYTITRDSIKVPTEFGFLFGRYTSGTVTFTDTDGFIYVYTKPTATP